MSWESSLRKIQTAQRHLEREALRRQKDLERRQKEWEKLSLLEQASLEVEKFNNVIEVLLSVHKEASCPMDWRRIASSFAPAPPLDAKSRSYRFLLQMRGKESEAWTPVERESMHDAQSGDEAEYQRLLENYQNKKADWEALCLLARAVLAGDPQAYGQAVSNLSPLAELATLGSEITFEVHCAHVVECRLTVNGTDIIPKEVKELTTTGKLKVKTMPKARFHDIYQDYVCGCVLRAARELLALLPVDTVLVTASVNEISAKTGIREDVPVLSIAAPRSVMERMDFAKQDPSDAMENFLCRGDAKSSKGTGVFAAIKPLVTSDLQVTPSRSIPLDVSLQQVRESREAIRGLLRSVDAETHAEAGTDTSLSAPNLL